MMQRLLIFLLAMILFVLVLVFTGCTSFTDASMGVAPPGGRIFTKQRAPMYLRLRDSGEAVKRSPQMKMGSVTVSNFVAPFTQNLLSVGWGDGTMDRAAKAAGIQTILFADYEMLSILGIYNRATVFVYGE